VTFTVDGVDVYELAASLREQAINISVSTIDFARYDFEARGLTAVNRASAHYYNTDEELTRLVNAVAIAGSAIPVRACKVCGSDRPMVAWMRSADAGGSPKLARASLTHATTPGDESARVKSKSQIMACTILLSYWRYGLAGTLAAAAGLGLSFVTASVSVFWIVPDTIKTSPVSPRLA